MEPQFYRENLESILEHSGGKHLLTMDEVLRYTGLKDSRAIHRRFPYFIGGYISAETLAKCLSSPQPKGLKRRAVGS